MLNRRLFVHGGLLAATAPAAIAAAAATAAASAPSSRRGGPPVAREEAVTDTVFGRPVVDPYRWMEAQPQSAEFAAYLKAQGAWARHALDALPRRKEIDARLAHYAAEQVVVFVRQVTDRFVVYGRRDPGEQVYRYYAMPLAGGAPQLLVDPSAGTKAGAPPRAVKSVLMSPDSRHLAYTVDLGGDEIHELRLLTLATREDVLVSNLNALHGSWLPDSSGLLYARARADAVRGSGDYNLGYTAWLHKLGTPAGADTLVLKTSEGEALGQSERELPQVAMEPGSDHALGLMYSNGDWPTYGFTAPAASLAAGKTPWQTAFRPDDQVVAAVLRGDDLYVLAKGRAERGEVWRVSAKAPAAANRVVVIPQGDHVIDSLALARDGLYVHELRGPGQVAGLKRYRFDSGRVEEIAMPREGAVWDVYACASQDGAWFGMDSLEWPAVTYRVDAAGKIADTGLTPPSPYDVSGFATTRLDVKVRDGAMVPVEIIHRKGARLDGRSPALMQAYGSYGLMLDPGFVPAMLAFVELGGIVVYAHVRGGGEKGEDWHRAGMKKTKPNTWRDAIDVAEWLVKERWSAHGLLALWGTSAGGIMVGRAITERPDLFAVAIGEVGMFNAMRFEVTANGPGNDLEFGSFRKEDEAPALFEMDAFHHVQPGVKYPATLLLTGANDARVEPWQIAKMAARMQKRSASGRAVLLRVDYASGHYSSTQKAAQQKHADLFAFVLANVRAKA
jgi:prolyl oligopeptidase